MANKIQFKRGLRPQIPELAYGEPGFVSDEKELYIGTEKGNIKLTSKSEINQINKQLDTIAFQVETKAQFDEAINKIKSNGGGSIILKSNIVLYDDETIYNENLYMLENLNYFKIIGNNYGLIFNDLNETEIFYVFGFKNCNNIDIGHLTCRGQKNAYPYIKSCAYLCMLYENNKNIKVHDIEAENLHGICGGRGSTHPIPIDETLKSENVDIYNITGNIICYAFSFAHNCNNVTIKNAKLNKVHRGYFVYGVKNHNVEIEVSNFEATACLLNTYHGRGLENIKLKCISKNNSDIGTPVASKTVQIKFGNKDRAIVKNIDIELDVENLHDKVDNVFDITFDGLNGINDNSGQHLIDGLKVSGKINGCVAGAISTTFYNNGNLENSTFKNIEIKNLSINNQGGNSNLLLEPLEGSCIIDNLVITGVYKRLYLTKNDNKECNIVIKNTTCGQITSSRFNNKATYQNCKFDDNYEFNFKNKIFINTLIKDKVYNITNNLDNSGLWWNNFNNIFLFKEIFDYNNKTNVTFNIEINNINFGSRYSQPYIFNFNVYFRDTTYARMGVIVGKILLKSNSQANNYLEYAKIIEQKFIPIGSDGSLTTATLTVNSYNKLLNLSLTTNNSSINDIGFELRV